MRFLFFACLMLAFSVHAQASPRDVLAVSICTTAETEAKANALDPSFFARLLWRESLFDPNVVSPVGAQGIAQFMPDTAARRGLVDPFEPLGAVKASANYLAELKKQFGNLGLAAAAYNAGEGRVQRWLDDTSSMPAETQEYVGFITGHSVEEWKTPTADFPIPAIGNKADFANNCVALALRKGTLSGTHLASAPRQPWGALLSVNFSEAKAVGQYKRLKLRFPDLIAKRDPLIIRKRNLSRGRLKLVYVMLGAKTQVVAAAMCGKLNAVGAPCIVRKN
jgi:Transglycosylase SLT domain